MIGIETDQLEQLVDGLEAGGRPAPVDPQRFTDQRLDRHPRVEGRERVLEHDLQVPSVQAQFRA
jgi:hypothetical protein